MIICNVISNSLPPLIFKCTSFIENLSCCIDKQCIDNKTVLRTDVLVYNKSLRILYSSYVVEKPNA